MGDLCVYVFFFCLSSSSNYNLCRKRNDKLYTLLMSSILTLHRVPKEHIELKQEKTQRKKYTCYTNN